MSRIENTYVGPAQTPVTQSAMNGSLDELSCQIGILRNKMEALRERLTPLLPLDFPDKARLATCQVHSTVPLIYIITEQATEVRSLHCQLELMLDYLVI